MGKDLNGKKQELIRVQSQSEKWKDEVKEKEKRLKEESKDKVKDAISAAKKSALISILQSQIKMTEEAAQMVTSLLPGTLWSGKRLS